MGSGNSKSSSRGKPGFLARFSSKTDAPHKSAPSQPMPKAPLSPPPAAKQAMAPDQAAKPAAPPGQASNAAPSGPEERLPFVAYQEGSYAGAPLPLNESDRMQCLCGLGVLDTPPDPKFDELTKLATMLFKVPIALVSLVDKDRQWFKSMQGLTARQTDRKSSFCAWTLLPEVVEVLVVQDALLDQRFAENPLVTGPPKIRFYAGCPLVTADGTRLGSFCIIDTTPRVFDAESCTMLANLGAMAVRELEKDVALAEQQKVAEALTAENNQLLRAIDAFTEGIILVNTGQDGWTVEFMNDAWENITGFGKEDLGTGFWSFFKLDDPHPERALAACREAIAHQRPFELTVWFLDNLRHKKVLTLTMRCAALENLDSFMPLVGTPALLPDTAPAGVPGAMPAPTYYFATLQPHQVSGPNTDKAATRSSATSITSSSGRSSGAGGMRSLMLLGEGRGDPFGDVQLGQLLGRGSFGRVYRARWNGATVAVKVLEYESGGRRSSDGGGFSRHSRISAVSMGDGQELGAPLECKEQLEALLSAQLSHPNVVQTYKQCSREVGRSASSGTPIMETWMVMEFCNRGTLSDAVERGEFRRRDSVFEPDFAALVATAKEIASAMCYLHARRILHGDLTANNVLLAGSHKDKRQFIAKVCDFGLSRSLEGRESISTRTMGTVTHMPPEVMLEGHQSLAMDVYAFGVILWELLAGQRPWHGLSHGQIIHAISTGKQLPLGSSCPTALRKFIYKCTSSKPQDRPTFPDILRDLEELEDELVGITTGEL